MYDIAKKGRNALKSKARRIAAGDNAKVDSSDWSPAPLINADKKTGARPVSPRLYKDGGKVSGDSSKPRADRPGRATGGATKIADAYVARNARKALGTAHVGAFKDGGVANKAALGAVDPKPHRAATPKPYKAGGRTGKDIGGTVKNMLNRLTGYKSPGEKMTENLKGVGSSSAPRYTESDKTALKEMVKGRSGSGLPEPEEGIEAAGRTGDKRGGRNWIKGAIKKPGALRKSLGVKEGEKIPAKKLEAASEKGGKLGQRARLAQTLKRMGKKTGGGVNLTVVVSDKDKQAAPRGGMPMGPMPPMGPAMAPPPPMPPAPPPPGLMSAAGAPPAGLGPMARKSGGRISKVASSYKDMEAGAGSGEGRLQKTDIASKHKNAPARKSGGKVYKSYKDMDAGAGSGEGRLEKTEIEARKMARRA
jgi:hypothetical protein